MLVRVQRSTCPATAEQASTLRHTSIETKPASWARGPHARPQRQSQTSDDGRPRPATSLPRPTAVEEASGKRRMQRQDTTLAVPAACCKRAAVHPARIAGWCWVRGDLGVGVSRPSRVEAGPSAEPWLRGRRPGGPRYVGSSRRPNAEIPSEHGVVRNLHT